MEKACQCQGIHGRGVAKQMITHGLRASNMSLLISSGFYDDSVALRTENHESRAYRPTKT